MTLRNLLLVTYHFPPHGGSGVQRPAKLAQYLPAAGWRAHVLTAGHCHYPLLDPTLQDDGGAETFVVRARGWEPGAIAATICRELRRVGVTGGRDAGAGDDPTGLDVHGMARWVDWLENRLYWRLGGFVRRLHLPETELLWVPSAIQAARRMIERHRIEAVVTTSPPLSAHLVGLSLKRRLRIPWIADLRDPIVDNFAHASRAGIVDRWMRRLERVVLSQADHCVVTCPDRSPAPWPPQDTRCTGSAAWAHLPLLPGTARPAPGSSCRSSRR